MVAGACVHSDRRDNRGSVFNAGVDVLEANDPTSEGLLAESRCAFRGMANAGIYALKGPDDPFGMGRASTNWGTAFL